MKLNPKTIRPLYEALKIPPRTGPRKQKSEVFLTLCSHGNVATYAGRTVVGVEFDAEEKSRERCPNGDEVGGVTLTEGPPRGISDV